ncbi:NADPH-dependent 2,4-dienoyl-CoA reductase, partial [Vibrio parahaemolyticus]|nr:NADPH-dependent 2,4-dienoyl-CoA reductase [Vibrio parahaemolyticus]
ILADPYVCAQAEQEKPLVINSCIGCYQACLDNVFKCKRASCVVIPLGCYETVIVVVPTFKIKYIDVVGAGPAGLACA